MPGSLRGDFSRLGLERQRRYSGVHLQQGRVLLDSDWNALVELLSGRLRTQVKDFIGPTGAPSESAGFRVIPRCALEFDGTAQYALLGEEPVPLFSRCEAMSVEIWIRPGREDGGGTFLSRFERSQMDDYRVPRYRLSREPDGRITFRTSGLAVSRLTSRSAAGAGRWCQVVLTHDAAACRLFVDGGREAESADGFEISGAGAVFLIGLAQLEGGRHPGFDGAVGAVRVWSRVLDDAEIERLREHEPAPDAPDLMGDWRFGEAAEGRVPDRTAHGNHAVLRALGESRPPAPTLEGLRIGAGRFYVDGILCENECEVDFREQPDLPDATPPALDAPGDYLLYLDAWERFVTAAQDPEISEPALGGPDTTARSLVVAQVKWLALPPPAGGAAGCAPAAETLRTAPSGSLRVRRRSDLPGPTGNHLYRVEIHTGGALYGWPRQSAEETAVAGRLEDGCRRFVPAAPLPPGGAPAVDDWVEITSDETDLDERAGPLARVTALDSETIGLAPAGPPEDLSAAGTVRLRRVATFKWSRDNGSIALPVRRLESGSRVAALGRVCPGEPRLGPGDWVEICDDRSILRGESAPLVRIDALDPQTLTVTLSEPPRGVGSRPELHPILRRWDQRGEADELAGGVVPVRAGAIALEHGIEIRFEGDGLYRPGDYWTFTTRSRTNELAWPRDEAGEPRKQRPHGVDHHLAPLALLRLREGGHELTDCRKIFRPRTEDAVSRAGDDMHGPLTIRPARAEGAALEVAGAARVAVLLGPLGSDDAVQTHNLAPRSVTAAKVAPEVGIVPPGYAILGEGPEPPPGYEPGDCALRVPVPEPTWEKRFEVEVGEVIGELHSVALDGTIFTLTDGGRLWQYDPGSGTVTPRRGAPETRRGFCLGEAHGRLYVIGGADESGRKIAATLEYDPEADVWTDRAPMPTPRTHAALAQIDGDLYAIGGLRDLLFLEVVTGRTEVYDPISDAWTRVRSVPAPRFAAAAVAGRRSIHFFGGERKWFFRWLGRGLSGHCQLYLPGLDRWSAAATLPAPRSSSAAAAVGEQLFVVGGRSLLGWIGETAAYAPSGDVWRRSAAAPPSPCRPGLAAIDGRLVLQSPGGSGDVVEIRELRVFHTFHVYRKAGAGGETSVPRLRLEPRTAPEGSPES